MKICITVGHSILKSGASTSASGVVNEYQYCKGLAPVLANVLKKEGHLVDVIICPEREFTNKNQEKSYKLLRINGKGYDLCVELHLNSFNKTAKGTEVLYYSNSGKMFAQRVVNKLGNIFSSRGVKERRELYILNGTDCPTILIETFFCDNQGDYDIAKKAGNEGVAKLIAEGILNKSISNENTSKPEGGNKMRKHCVLYESEVDHHIAEIFSWYFDDCAVVKVDDFTSFMAHNLYVVGGITKKKLDSKNFKDKYTAFAGVNRFETLNKAMAFATSRGEY